MLRTHQTRRVAVILVPDANLLQKRDPKNEEAMRQFIGPKKSLALGPRSRGLRMAGTYVVYTFFLALAARFWNALWRG